MSSGFKLKRGNTYSNLNVRAGDILETLAYISFHNPCWILTSCKAFCFQPTSKLGLDLASMNSATTQILSLKKALASASNAGKIEVDWREFKGVLALQGKAEIWAIHAYRKSRTSCYNWKQRSKLQRNYYEWVYCLYCLSMRRCGQTRI